MVEFILYEGSNQQLIDNLEKNFYYPRKKSHLFLRGSEICFDPSDERDHIATPFIDLVQPVASNPWLISEIFFPRKNFETCNPCSMVLQDSHYNEIAVFDFSKEEIQKNTRRIQIFYELPEHFPEFRLVFYPVKGQPSLMPSSLRIIQTESSNIDGISGMRPEGQKIILSKRSGLIRRLPGLDERTLYHEIKGISFEEISGCFHNDPWILNYITNAWEFVHKKTELWSYPYDQTYAIGCNCNANCIFCLTRHLRAKHHDVFMDPDQWYHFRHILKYARTVGIPGPGEPLLHPEFQKLIQNLSIYIDPRCAVYLITNGVLINRFLDFFGNSPIKTFDISLNASSSETHARIMRVHPNTFHHVIENIQSLIDLRDSKHCNIAVNLTLIVISENIQEIPDFIELGNRLQVNGLFIRPFTTECGKDRRETDYLNLVPTNNADFNYHYEKALAAISRSRIPVYTKPDTWINRLNHTAPHNCPLLYRNLYLHNEFNRFWPCCIIGDMDAIHPIPYDGSDDFMQAWNSSTMVNLRKSLLFGPLNNCCKTCNIDLYG